MKNWAAFLILFPTLTVGQATETGIELRGVLSEAGTIRLSLSDRATDTTRWVEVGQPFSGYQVSAYDASTETVTLRKDGGVLQLRLQTSLIAGASQPTPPTAKTAAEIEEAIGHNLRQIHGATRQYILEYQVGVVTLDELVGPDKYIKRLVPVDGESYASLQLNGSSQPLSVVTAHGQRIEFWPAGKPEPMRENNQSFTYTVKAGETASTIARQLGIPVVDLVRENPSLDWSKLKVGQTIRTPK